jgi:Spy/CpxP family protein refolding chaperone
MLNKNFGLYAGLGAVLVLGMAVVAAGATPAPNTGTDKVKTEKAEPPAPGADGEGGMGHRLQAEMNLTDEQLAKLKAERLNTRKQMIRDMAEIKTLHLDLFDEIQNDKPDLDKVERLVKQIGELQTKMLLARTQGIIFLRSILTPEQKRKFGEMHMRMGFEGDAGPWEEPHGRPRHEGRPGPGEEK